MKTTQPDAFYANNGESMLAAAIRQINPKPHVFSSPYHISRSELCNKLLYFLASDFGFSSQRLSCRTGDSCSPRSSQLPDSLICSPLPPFFIDRTRLVFVNQRYREKVLIHEAS